MLPAVSVHVFPPGKCFSTGFTYELFPVPSMNQTMAGETLFGGEQAAASKTCESSLATMRLFVLFSVRNVQLLTAYFTLVFAVNPTIPRKITISICYIPNKNLTY